MKKCVSISIIVMVCISLGSCISFKIKPQLPGDNQVEYIHLCKGIDDSGDLLKPLDIQSEFTSQDSHINCFIRLKNVSSKIYLRWRWYSPDKKMVRDTGDVIVNQDEKYLRAVTAYDKVKLNPEEKIGGQWTVSIFINNKFIGKKEFQVI